MKVSFDGYDSGEDQWLPDADPALLLPSEGDGRTDLDRARYFRQQRGMQRSSLELSNQEERPVVGVSPVVGGVALQPNAMSHTESREGGAPKATQEQERVVCEREGEMERLREELERVSTVSLVKSSIFLKPLA